MNDFKHYLAEAIKQYDYRIKVAGDIDKDFTSRMETCLQKYEVKKLSAGKKTPIQEHPLDFPALKNQLVNIFELTTNYPVSVRELKEYIADHMDVSPIMIVVKKPGEPTEEYQEQMKDKSEYQNLLQTVEMGSASDVKPEDMYGDKANMSLLKELLKDRDKTEFAKTEKTQEVQSKEDEGSPSPLTKAAHDGPIKGNPDPAGK